MRDTTDFLIIGSGIAGLFFAIHAAKFGNVTMVTKKSDKESNTNYAQGGIACVVHPEDSFKLHIQDSIITGNGLSNKLSIKKIVEGGPESIKELLALGVNFTGSLSSKAFANLDLGREGGHTANRIVHARDLTGKELETSLLNRIKQIQNIKLYENHCLVELLTNHHLKNKLRKNTCYGAYIFDTIKKSIFPIRSKITYLATGGIGQVYLHTTNPDIATGDGIACAYRAGVQIRNMEFIQFHPTTLFHPDSDSFLISEALRGYGAVLKNSDGKEFMDEYHPMKSLAPRDIVARAIDNVMKISGEKCVYLDITHIPAENVKNRFPTIFARCKEFGIDITKDLIPVVPACHYNCGGVKTDLSGRTTMNNLYAGGETSCTGAHGANRLASNSLLEALVFSKSAAEHAGKRIKSISLIPHKLFLQWDDSGTIDNEEWILISHNLSEIKNIMWNYVGIVRSNLRLKRAMRRIKLLEKETEDFYKRTKVTMKLLELRNIITVSKLIVISALKRHESRGLHFTIDYPEKNDRYWKRDTILTRNNCL